MNRYRDRRVYIRQQVQQLVPAAYDVVARVEQFDEVVNSVGLANLVPSRY